MNASFHRVLASLATLLVLFASTAASAVAPQMLTGFRGAVNNAAGAHATSRTAVQFNAAQLLGLPMRSEVELTLPNGGKHAYVVDLVQYHGDGKADIVWVHEDGRLAVWIMNGTTLLDGMEILGPASGWSLSPGT